MIEGDIVYHGRIRPAMYAGVSHAWFLVELLVPILLFVLLQSFWPFVVVPVAHLLGMLATAKDSRFLEVEMARARCFAPLRRVYGYNVYSR